MRKRGKEKGKIRKMEEKGQEEKQNIKGRRCRDKKENKEEVKC